MHAQEYALLEFLGEGSTAHVYLAEWCSTVPSHAQQHGGASGLAHEHRPDAEEQGDVHSPPGQRVAIKVIDKLLVRHAGLESKVRQEMVLHAQLRHPSVLRVLVRVAAVLLCLVVIVRVGFNRERESVWSHTTAASVATSRQEAFEDARNYYMVLEFCERRSVAALVKALPGRRLDDATAKRVFFEVGGRMGRCVRVALGCICPCGWSALELRRAVNGRRTDACL